MTITRRDFLDHCLRSTLAVPLVLATPRWSMAQQVRVTTVAGTGVAGYEADGSSSLIATTTPVNNPYGVAIGPDGGLYFCEVDSGRTRRLDLSSGRLTTIAGNGNKAYSGDGQPALNAAFSAPHELCFDRAGNLYVVERDAHVVRRIAVGSHQVSTFAGTGEAGFSGDEGPAAQAQLRQPHSIAFDAAGGLLICDIGNQRIRRVDPVTGLITTLSGDGTRDATPDNAPLAGTPLRGPRSLTTDSAGNAYLVLREGNAVYQLNLTAQRLQRIAGTGAQGFTGDSGPGLDATFNGPKGIAYSAADHCLYIVDTENHVIRRLQLASGVISTVLGTGAVGDGPDGDPLQCALSRPHGVCVHNGIVYVSDSENHRLRAIQGLM